MTPRSDQPRSGTAINAAVKVIGDRCWLPVLRDVMFGNTSATSRNDLKWESPRTSSPTGSASEGGKTFTFGGIETGLRATLTTQAGQPTVGQQAWVPNQVARDTIFTFLAGRQVFELTDPDGHVYVMQSYAQVVDPTMTYRDLLRLGSILNCRRAGPTPPRCSPRHSS